MYPATDCPNVRHRAGFSLVELSIVLVILGLLTGGILGGQALIHASELRSISNDYSKYVTAMNTFRDKYQALPGDFTTAQDVWGVADAVAGTCITTPSTDSKTCNGDGDGQIDLSAGSNEYFRFWQHLANAGLIEGSYNGVAGALGNNDSSSSNAPSSRLANGLWQARYVGDINSAHTAYFEGSYNNIFQFGLDTTASSGDNDAGITNAEDMWNVDTKIDDGKPGYGKLVSRENRANCVTTTSYDTAEYNVTVSGVTSQSCVYLFRGL